MREKAGKWYKERKKCIIKSRIEFPDPMLMTLDTPHGPNTKFLKKCLKNAGKTLLHQQVLLLSASLTQCLCGTVQTGTGKVD